MQKHKDNPVPSLDKIKQLHEEYESGKRTHINTLYEIGRILQNGVETDKEQLRCKNKCTFNGDYMLPKCKVCGLDID